MDYTQRCSRVFISQLSLLQSLSAEVGSGELCLEGEENIMSNKLRILSLGAGVQSSTLALMIEKGEIPMVDAAIFADVKGEPKAVTDWLEYLKKHKSLHFQSTL